MTLDDIARIVTRLETTDVTECEIEHGTRKVRIRRDRTAGTVFSGDPSVISPSRVEDNAIQSKPRTVILAAPAIGIFRETHPLADPAASSSATVRPGQHLGYLEIDSVLCAISAPANGTLKGLFVREKQLVSYGQPVVEMDLNDPEPATA